MLTAAGACFFDYLRKSSNGFQNQCFAEAHLHGKNNPVLHNKPGNFINRWLSTFHNPRNILQISF
jgi:hypothetical protein